MYAHEMQLVFQYDESAYANLMRCRKGEIASSQNLGGYWKFPIKKIREKVEYTILKF
jgi:hypothetical protein